MIETLLLKHESKMGKIDKYKPIILHYKLHNLTFHAVLDYNKSLYQYPGNIDNYLPIILSCIERKDWGIHLLSLKEGNTHTTIPWETIEKETTDWATDMSDNIE